MTMKEIIPMLLLIAAPEAGMAQNKAGIRMENLDKTVSPSENFYKFACGGWQKLNPLPSAYSRFGSFDQLQEDNNQRINGIIASLTQKKFAEGSVEKKLSDFYKLAMDSTRRNAEGVAPVKPVMDEIEAAKDIEALRKLQLKYAVIGLGVPYGYYFGSDEKNATMNILNLMQGGLTLGEKDYYLDNDKATADIRQAYARHIETMFGIYGFSEAQAKARSRAIMRFETALALISKNRTELRDVEANYNKMTLAEFQSSYPNIALAEPDVQKIHPAQAARERLGQRRVAQAERIGDRVDVFLRRADEVRHALDDAARVFAHMRQPVLAHPAAAAAPVRVDGHAVAGSKPCHVRADFLDHAGDLMPQRDGQAERTRAAFALEFVQIRAADAAVGDGDPDGVRIHRRFCELAQMRLMPPGQNDCFHSILSFAYFFQLQYKPVCDKTQQKIHPNCNGFGKAESP